MVTFLAGGTGTPKLLAGAGSVFHPEETTVVANTGDDIELGGLLVCPDLDTVLFLEAGILDRETWWGIDGDTTRTHEALRDIAERSDLSRGPRYLPDDAQTGGRRLARWRRFSGVGEFMEIGDRDRAVHITRTSLLDEGHTLTEITQMLADGFGLERDLLPMSNDPVASIVHTDEGSMHFQEYWVGRRGAPGVQDVEFRGADAAVPTDDTVRALNDPVAIGPSNPVTSIGPILSMESVPERLRATPVVAVSPFVEDRVFSGPAADLMAGIGMDPSTGGVADAYPFVDAFVLDEADGTVLDRPVIRTDIALDTHSDAKRVARAVDRAFEEVGI